MRLSILLLSLAVAVHSQVPLDPVNPISSSNPIATAPLTGADTMNSTIPKAPDFSNNRVQCSGRSRRKEVRQLKQEGGFDRFIQAFKAMAADGSLAELVNLHGPAPGFWAHAHFTPRFLPFHRIYLKEMEKALQQRGAPYLPYWDWSLDSQKPWNSPILGPEYFGSPDKDTHQVANSVFGRSQYVTPIGGNPLVRDYNPTGQ